jgi:hypothetical protein
LKQPHKRQNGVLGKNTIGAVVNQISRTSKNKFLETQTIPHDLVVSHGGRIEVENQVPS